MNNPFRSSRRIFIIVLASLVVAYALYDVFLPISRDLRSFDPHEMARLETAMWESYYDRHPVKIYFELAEMLRTQFHFPFLRSFVGAYYAARAAFIFKDHKNPDDLLHAGQTLASYFSLIHKTGNIPFNVNAAAHLELRWWIVHRQRNIYTVEQLGEACANAAAVLYQIPPERAAEHGRLRAEAMVIRDTKAKEGGVQPEDWRHIEELLLRCYESLHVAITSPSFLSYD